MKYAITKMLMKLKKKIKPKIILTKEKVIHNIPNNWNERDYTDYFSVLDIHELHQKIEQKDKRILKYCIWYENKEHTVSPDYLLIFNRQQSKKLKPVWVKDYPKECIPIAKSGTLKVE